MDPKDFEMLHQSMEDAISPNNKVKNYYSYREEKDDGGYLAELVTTCQRSLRSTLQYEIIKSYITHLGSMYNGLQVHKHVEKKDRIPRLIHWFEHYKERWPFLSWYEFSASSGSTLGIFCLVSYALGERMTEKLAKDIFDSYFPFMQGLHILLDYYIDQQEDLLEDDLNFCNYYDNPEHMEKRLLYFIQQTNQKVQNLPDKQFHEMVHNGLVGLYLADRKVKRLDGYKQFKKLLLNKSGSKAKFFYFNVKMYRKILK